MNVRVCKDPADKYPCVYTHSFVIHKKVELQVLSVNIQAILLALLDKLHCTFNLEHSTDYRILTFEVKAFVQCFPLLLTSGKNLFGTMLLKDMSV